MCDAEDARTVASRLIDFYGLLHVVGRQTDGRFARILVRIGIDGEFQRTFFQRAGSLRFTDPLLGGRDLEIDVRIDP